MRRYLVVLLVVAVVLGLALPAIAGGMKNTTYVKFSAGSTVYDSYWKDVPSGLVHEWRPTDSKHFVFKPRGDKFTAPNCKTRLYDEYGIDIGPNPDFVRGWLWTFNPAPYTDLGGDGGDLGDFLTPGAQYYVCMYHW